MTWEETIKQIRQQPEFSDLVRDAYFDPDLRANVDRFKTSEEFIETLRILRIEAPLARTIADIGSGNGISTLAFALQGYSVYAIEPDPSETIGAGAIKALSVEYQMGEMVKVIERFGEDTGLPDESVEVVYIRQAMHHAHDLGRMMAEAFRILSKGGLLMTVRDHVIFDSADKEWFLKMHPLHKFYGGENAYTEEQYRTAITDAGFSIIKMLRYYESVINFYPMTRVEVEGMPARKEERITNSLRKKVGPLASVKLVRELYKKFKDVSAKDIFNEKAVPGRLYTFLARKPL